MKKSIGIILLLMILSLIGCGKDKPTYKMSENTEPKISHTTETKVNKIEFIDEYILKGIQYYDIKTSLFDEGITLSENEYNSLFGEGNDALETDIYELELKIDLVKYQKDWGWEINPIDELCQDFNTGDNKDFFHHVLFDSASSAEYTHYDTILNLDENSYYDVTKHNYKRISISQSEDESSATASITLKRYSIFGETDFTEAEIKEYEKELINMGLEFIQTYIKED